MLVGTGTAHHLHYDTSGQAVWIERQLALPEGISPEESAKLLIEASFGKQSPNFAPPGTQVATLIISDGHMVVNLTKQAMGFGQDYYESTIRKQIIKTALGIEGISCITTLVDRGHYYRYQEPVSTKYTPWGSNPGPAD